jgi:D-psicose/D-tagatose/L-ribulose 3-epimerase
MTNDTLGIRNAHQSRSGRKGSSVDVQHRCSREDDEIMPPIVRSSIRRRVTVPAIPPRKVSQLERLRFEDPAQRMALERAIVRVTRARLNHKRTVADSPPVSKSGRSYRFALLVILWLMPLAWVRAASSNPVPGFPIGWCILPKPEVFSDAKKAGYEYVELAMQSVLPMSDAEFATLCAQLRASGIPALSGYNIVPADLRLTGAEIDAARQEAHIARVVARARALDLRYVILNAGAAWKVPEGFSRELAFRQLADFGQRLAARAGRAGLTVLVEPLRPSDSNMIVTIAEAIALVEAVDHPQFAMMVDYSFLRIGKDDPNALLKAGRHLRHVHLANPSQNPRVYAFDAAESDYASFFAVLKSIGYRGGLSVHAGSPDPLAQAPKAIAFLRQQALGLADSK